LASPERSVDALLRNVAGVQLQNNDAETLHPMVPSLSLRGVGIGDTADRGFWRTFHASMGVVFGSRYSFT
jgi:hypothetical protein